MGLDMYLFGVTSIIDGETCKPVIKAEEVAYWSKHNAIHNWMLKNIQNGVDNGALYYLDDSHLKKLLVACKQVLAKPTVEHAMCVLPTLSGPFFGGTNLNDEYEFEYYLDGLKYTVKMIRDVLENGGYEYYYYHASW